MDDIEVICIGAAIIDTPLQPMSKSILDIDSYPLERIAMTTGGDATNEATIISYLGRRAALASRIGDDAAGYFIADHCHRESTDIRSLKQDADIDTSINVGLITVGGKCTFMTNCSGSLRKLSVNGVDFDRFSQVELLPLASISNSPLLDGGALAVIFTQAKAHKLITYVDTIKPRLNETLDDIREALSYVDYLFLSFEGAKLFTGKDTLDEVVDNFLNCGIETVVIKTDKGSCFTKRVDMEMVVPAVSGTTTIDTIGAGNNFVSGFIPMLLEGKPLHDCTLSANATAAISVLSVGATMGVKDGKLVEQLLDEYEE